MVHNPFRFASFLSIASIVIVSSGSASREENDHEFIYLQRLTHESVVVAWGSPRGESSNTIGESSLPFGPAELDVFYRQGGEPIPGSPFLTSELNWIEVPLPEPSTDYGYELRVNGGPWGDGVYRRERLLHFRSFPGPDVDAGTLSFLVLGDFGTGSKKQFRLAETMRRVVDERERAGSPVRFVLTTGDNFYDFFLFVSTGSDDEQFYKKFLVPYQSLVSRIPFFPSPGNHDGSESESTQDLFHYRDNFFLPAAILPNGTPSRFEDRFYSVRYGKDVLLLSLDTTRNRETKANVTWQPLYGGEGVSEQRLWLESELARARDTLWKIAYFHHPPFNAGPGHYGPRAKDRNLIELERELVPLLAFGEVRVVFSGHVHNFQLTRQESEGYLRTTRYIVTGAGGRSDGGRRRGSLELLRREKMEATNAEDEPHFLLVHIEGDRMEITPITYGGRDLRPKPLAVRTHDNRVFTGTGGWGENGSHGGGDRKSLSPDRHRGAAPLDSLSSEIAQWISSRTCSSSSRSKRLRSGVSASCRPSSPNAHAA